MAREKDYQKPKIAVLKQDFCDIVATSDQGEWDPIILDMVEEVKEVERVSPIRDIFVD